jgi:hypothetical protein
VILPLRRLHRVAFAVLVVVLPVVFAAGLAARRPPPTMDRLPAALQDGAVPLAFVHVERHTVWAGRDVTVRLRADADPPSRAEVEVSSGEAIDRPDLLLYWADSGSAPAAALPAGARLLGGWAGVGTRRLALSPDAIARGGTLVLYSLGLQEVVGTLAMPYRDTGTAREGRSTPDVPIPARRTALPRRSLVFGHFHARPANTIRRRTSLLTRRMSRAHRIVRGTVCALNVARAILPACDRPSSASVRLRSRESVKPQRTALPRRSSPAGSGPRVCARRPHGRNRP